MYIIGCISQKGGVGKSTIARLIAREFAAADYKVRIADLDLHQSTATSWVRERIKNDIKPDIASEPAKSISAAIKNADGVDVLIFDGKPYADQQTMDIAKAAGILVIPSGASRDDLFPTVKIVHALVSKGIPARKIRIVLNGNFTEAEEADARAYLAEAQLACLDSALPNMASYRLAMNNGYAASEVKVPRLRELAQKIASSVAELAMEEV